MTLESQAKAFFAAHPQLRFGVLGPQQNLALLPDTVCGVPVVKLTTEEHPLLAEQYLATNHLAFGRLSLLRWVLSDLYLLPGFIGVLLTDPEQLAPELREHLNPEEGRRVIGAAYVAAPTLHPGRVVGVSLLSFLQTRGAAAWVKTLTLKLWRAHTLQGITQWDSPSLRVHTRLGPLKLIGRPPGGHEFADRTFIYQTDLSDDAAWAKAMARALPTPKLKPVPARDYTALNALLDRALRGEDLRIAPPGLEDGKLLLIEA